MFQGFHLLETVYSLKAYIAYGSDKGKWHPFRKIHKLL